MLVNRQLTSISPAGFFSVGYVPCVDPWLSPIGYLAFAGYLLAPLDREWTAVNRLREGKGAAHDDLTDEIPRVFGASGRCDGLG